MTEVYGSPRYGPQPRYNPILESRRSVAQASDHRPVVGQSTSTATNPVWYQGKRSGRSSR